MSDSQAVKTKRHGLPIVVIAALFWIVLSGFSNPLADYVKDGNKAFEDGDFEKALEHYNKAREVYPDSPEVSFNLGNTYYKLENMEKALEFYQQAQVTAKPELQQWTAYNIGNTLLAQGKYADAVDAYIEALRLNPRDEDAKYNLELTQKLLEIQKQQQQEQNDSCDNPQQGDQGDEQQSQDQKQSQNKDQQQQQQQDEKQKQQAQQKQQEQEKQEAEQKQAQKQEEKKDDQPDEEKKAAGASKADDQEEPPEGEQDEAVLISPAQAAQILDALEEQEQEEQKNQLRAPQGKDQPDKDW